MIEQFEEAEADEDAQEDILSIMSGLELNKVNVQYSLIRARFSGSYVGSRLKFISSTRSLYATILRVLLASDYGRWLSLVSRSQSPTRFRVRS